MDYNTIIVGGGPAGLSAALVLGRCRRRVLVIDEGRPRNRVSRRVGGYLTRDGVAPEKLLGLGRAELDEYGVEFKEAKVQRASCLPGDDGGFEVWAARARRTTRTLLLATGVADELPDLPDADRFYGTGVHHCPYCDAWDHRDKPLAAFGEPRKALGLALNLRTWSDDVTVLTHGEPAPRSVRRDAELQGVAIRTEPIRALAGTSGRGGRPRLRTIAFADGPDLRISALFFNTGQYQRSELPGLLGCRLKEGGGVAHDRRQRTGVPGLYLAGDASKDVQFVIVAAAEGAKAAVGINADLQKQDVRRRAEGARQST